MQKDIFMIKLLPTLLALILAPFTAFSTSPLGLWTTIDEKSGKKRALVEFYETGDTINGKIVEIYHHKPDDVSLCAKCPGKFKNKPILGLQFIWGLKKTGPKSWSEGKILDCKKGKIYRLKMKLKGDTLRVRGYIGSSLFGRSQTWIR